MVTNVTATVTGDASETGMTEHTAMHAPAFIFPPSPPQPPQSFGSESREAAALLIFAAMFPAWASEMLAPRIKVIPRHRTARKCHERHCMARV